MFIGIDQNVLAKKRGDRDTYGHTRSAARDRPVALLLTSRFPGRKGYHGKDWQGRNGK